MRSERSHVREFVVEVFFMTPAKRIPNPVFRNETMDMWVTFQVPAKSMKDTDKTRSKEFGFVLFAAGSAK